MSKCGICVYVCVGGGTSVWYGETATRIKKWIQTLYLSLSGIDIMTHIYTKCFFLLPIIYTNLGNSLVMTHTYTISKNWLVPRVVMRSTGTQRDSDRATL